jgi:pyrroloquinoline-quinone synthase
VSEHGDRDERSESRSRESAASPRRAASLTDRLRAEGARRYHDHHAFHVRMHEGTLSRRMLQLWVENRYYYQTRIPIKDAIIVSKSEDPAFRRMWLRRIVDHDGDQAGDGGLALWLRLAEGVGLPRERVASHARVLPRVRVVCDRYVALVRERSLVEAVASSLTEFFAPDLMSKRIEAWERHYPWIDAEALAYFRSRVTRARRDSGEAIEFVEQHATTPALQDACVAALVAKCEILWEMLEAIATAASANLRLASRARLREDGLLVWPERGMALNPTAQTIVRLLDGTRSEDAIVAALREKWPDARTAEVSDFLIELDRRGLFQ